MSLLAFVHPLCEENGYCPRGRRSKRYSDPKRSSISLIHLCIMVRYPGLISLRNSSWGEDAIPKLFGRGRAAVLRFLRFL